MRSYLALAIAGVGIACAVGRQVAHADTSPRAVHVDVDAGVPVQPSELASALRVRLSPGRALAVRVTAVREGVVSVAVGDDATDRTRLVEIGTFVGGDAARLIALAVADLTLDDLAIAPPPAAPLRVSAVAAPPVARHPRSVGQLSLAVLGSASAWSAPLVGGGLDAVYARGVPAPTAWLGFVEVDGGTLVTGALQLDAVTVRAGVGVRFATIDLRAGATAVPIWVSNGAGDQTVLLGGNVAARLRLPLAEGLHAVVAVGADAFATRSVYAIAAATTVGTPWVSPYLAVGLDFTP